MATFEQSELAYAPEVLSVLGDTNQACFGVYASVVTPGTVRVSEPVAV